MRAEGKASIQEKENTVEKRNTDDKCKEITEFMWCQIVTQHCGRMYRRWKLQKMKLH